MPDTQSIAAANMFDLMNQLTSIGQNVTNATTPAYKSIQTFESALKTSPVDARSGSNMNSHVQIDLSQGSLNATGKSLDIALTGPGFFVVDSDGNQYLSRLGQLTISPNGTLADSNGASIMGQQGPIFLDSEDVEIHSDGRITSEGSEIDQLQIVNIRDASSLSVTPNGYFSYSGTLESANSNDVQILQGFFESSNVDVASETVRMIEMMRRFEMQQKILKANDAMLRGGITVLGEF